MTARLALDHALTSLAADGGRPRCGEPSDHQMWTSDDIAERRRAAELCVRCPLLMLCADAAEEDAERFGVWGGHDRTKPARATTNNATNTRTTNTTKTKD